MPDARSLVVRRLARLGNERLRALSSGGSGAALRPALRWIAGGTIEVPLGLGRGLRLDMRGIPISHAHLGGLAFGIVEQPVQEAIRRHLGPGDVFYDIGANVGFFSLLGARFAGEAGHVYAFEPTRDNAAAIAASAAVNGLANVTVVEKAAGPAAGTGRLQVVDDQSWSKLAETGDHPLTAEVVDVEVVAIDDLDLRPPTLVKIDVEGYEVPVLEGMRRTLAEHAPAVICELHGTAPEFVAFMDDVGYRIVNLESPGPVEAADAPAHALALPPGHFGG